VLFRSAGHGRIRRGAGARAPRSPPTHRRSRGRRDVMQTQSNMPSMASELDEQLSAYFDDELDEAVRASVEAELERDPELAARLADLTLMRTIGAGNPENQAERVPRAPSEQTWD